MEATIPVRAHHSLIVLAEERHFGRAALKLHIAPTTLEIRVTQLEQKLSLTLFRRNGMSVELTSDGRIYLNAARASLRYMEGISSTGHRDR